MYYFSWEGNKIVELLSKGSLESPDFTIFKMDYTGFNSGSGRHPTASLDGCELNTCISKVVHSGLRVSEVMFLTLWEGNKGEGLSALLSTSFKPCSFTVQLSSNLIIQTFTHCMSRSGERERTLACSCSSSWCAVGLDVLWSEVSFFGWIIRDCPDCGEH